MSTLKTLTVPYRIRLADTDAAGVVYFAHLLHICHIAYEEILVKNEINLQEWVKQGTIAMPIVHGEIDCLRPIYWGDLVWILLTPHFLSETELEITYHLTTEAQPDNILAKGKTRHVCIDPKTRKRIPFPSPMQSVLNTS